MCFKPITTPKPQTTNINSLSPYSTCKATSYKPNPSDIPKENTSSSTSSKETVLPHHPPPPPLTSSTPPSSSLYLTKRKHPFTYNTLHS